MNRHWDERADAAQMMDTESITDEREHRDQQHRKSKRLRKQSQPVPLTG